MSKIYPWQQDIWQALTKRQQQAHAYLLHGPAGSGKQQMAEHFAQFLLCRQPAVDQPCGQCSSCKLYLADSHPDMLRVEPEEEGKGILIARIRELVAQIQQTPQQGGRLVVLLQPAEAMTIESSNALLKSLEEPTSSTVFILITHQLSFLLPTIKSRCVLQACPLPDAEQAHGWLHAQLGQEQAGHARQLLALAAGSPLRALEFAQNSVLESRAEVVEGVKQLIKRQVSAVELAARWNKLSLLLLLEWFSQWNQAMLRFQLTQDQQHLGQEDMRVVLGHMAKFANAQDIFALQQWLLERRQKLLLRAPLQEQLILETLLAQWLQLFKKNG